MQHESEAKKFARRFKIVGALIMLAAVPSCVYVATMQSHNGITASMVALGVGFVVFLIGRSMD